MSRLHRIASYDHPLEADVVFIHGLGGGAFSTWSAGTGESESWPYWLSKEFPNVGVWSLETQVHPTRASGSFLPLPDQARQILETMVQSGLGQRPLLLVGHSLGGLLAKQILRTSRDAQGKRHAKIAERTRGVLFLATPQRGTSLAARLSALRTVFGAGVNLDDLREYDQHLRDLYDWYRTQVQPTVVETVSYFETRPVRGVLPLVNATSAHPGVGADPMGLAEDHLSIAQPRSGEDLVCAAARRLLVEHVLPRPAEARSQTA